MAESSLRRRRLQPQTEEAIRIKRPMEPVPIRMQPGSEPARTVRTTENGWRNRQTDRYRRDRECTLVVIVMIRRVSAALLGLGRLLLLLYLPLLRLCFLEYVIH
jgi:hypothetical protein